MKNTNKYFFINDFSGPIIATILITVFSFFIILYNLDLQVSSYFWDPLASFSFKDTFLEFIIYESINWAVIVTLFFSIAFLSYSKITNKFIQYKVVTKSYLMALIISPGIIVNALLKSNWGRPRPIQTIDFNGRYQYQEFFEHNLGGFGNSFSSGHASVPLIFIIFGLYFINKKNISIGRIIIYFSIVWYVATSMARIMAGGHFLSDVLWSGYISYLTVWASHKYYFLPRAN
ncbi:MAG: hypothetical protein CBC38_01030 [Gammaproteobacteria bacterium TMED78]|nr:MAG: hypothetical protein CBC38_01030 [Gammaproteobacteria bacterium TMED78]